MRGVLIVFALWASIGLTCIVGYGMNIMKLIGCDFKPSYKAEIVRIVGLPVFPVGVIAGWFSNETLGEPKK